jgi:hypothetical protein
MQSVWLIAFFNPTGNRDALGDALSRLQGCIVRRRRVF